MHNVCVFVFFKAVDTLDEDLCARASTSVSLILLKLLDVFE